MDMSANRYFVLVRKISSFLGLWPAQTYKERFLRTCVVSCMLLYSVVAQLCQVLTSDFDLQSIVRLLQVSIPYLCTVNIYGTVLLHFVNIQSIFTYIVNDWEQVEDKTEIKIMHSYGDQSKVLIQFCGSIYGFVTFFTLFSFIVRIIISTNDTIYDMDRYPIFSCLDYFSGQKRYYYLMIILQTLTGILMLTVALILYSMYFLIVLHVCARLRIIQYKLHQPFQTDRYNDNVREKSLDLPDWIIDIILYTSKTRKLIALVNKVYEMANVFQIFMTLIILVINFFCMYKIPHLIQHADNIQETVLYLFNILSAIIIAYVICYKGQIIIDCSLDIYKEASFIPIYNISLKTQKLLLTTLALNAKPYAISVGRVFVSSHEFFSDLLRTSLSFATVLHSIQRI